MNKTEAIISILEKDERALKSDDMILYNAIVDAGHDPEKMSLGDWLRSTKKRREMTLGVYTPKDTTCSRVRRGYLEQHEELKPKDADRMKKTKNMSKDEKEELRKSELEKMLFVPQYVL